MTGYDHFIRLLVLAGLMATGVILTSAFTGIFLLLQGMSMEDLMAMAQSGAMDFTPGMTRIIVIAQHLLVFIFPALIFGLLYYRPKWLEGLGLSVSPGWIPSILGIFFLMAAYPLVNLGLIVNEAIPLPDWTADLEDQAADTLKLIMTNMNLPGVLIINLVIIAILPGIGEELIFRGIIQKQTGLILKSPIAAIWIAAFIFSAIHFQFEGFLPRMVLGAVLGYLLHWSGNLWVPIIAHAFNNGIQVILIYMTGMDMSTFDEESSNQLKWWMIPLSLGVMYILYTTIAKNRKLSEQV